MALLPRRSAAARRREWLTQDRLRAGFEKALQRRMVKAIGDAAVDAASGYRDGGLASMQDAFLRHRVAVRQVLFPHYRVVMQRFGDRLLEQPKADSRHESCHNGVIDPNRITEDDAIFKPTDWHSVVMETRDATGVFERKMAQWIVGFGAKKVVKISTTTMHLIQDQVFIGVTEGLSVDATARLIVEKTGGKIARARSITIARTETHSASVAAGDVATDALGIKVKREWIAAGDERTRISHAEADGQLRDQGQPFDVGNASLMYPGDPGGPPGEIINCRCVVGYIAPAP